jgi:hypothetical protein
MNNYLIIITGWFLGQAAYACKKSWDLQKRNDKLSFKEALKMHFTKETGAFAFGSIMLLIAMFVISDFINLDVTKQELKNMEAAKWKIYLINFLRGISVLFGYLCQNLGYFLFGRSEKILRQRATSEGVNIPDN